MGAGFQRNDTRYSTGAFGTDPFGTSHFGGTDWPVVTLPTLHLDSDDLTKQHRWKVGEVQHRRDGILLGSRKWNEKRVWRVEWIAKDEAFVLSMLTFFQQRVFRMLPDSADPITYFLVQWSESEFHPTPRRARRYDLKFTIEET